MPILFAYNENWQGFNSVDYVVVTILVRHPSNPHLQEFREFSQFRDFLQQCEMSTLNN